MQRISLHPAIGQYLTPDSAINDMLELDQVVGVRSMALAIPDSTLFPTDIFWDNLSHLRSQANELMGYGPIQGDTALRIALMKLIEEKGITAVPEDIFITSGTLQGLSLVTQTIADAGDNALVDAPTFLGMLNILKAQKINPITVSFAADGPDLDAFEHAIHIHKPRFYYAVPTFHNPTGHTISTEKRTAILHLAQKHNIMIVEDDIYSDLAYDGPTPPTFTAQDTNDRVIYISGFSKSVMPGMRVGYIVMPPQLRTRLQTLRRATDLCGTVFVQRALAHFIQNGSFKQHLKRVIPIYRDRRDALLATLRTTMPPVVNWSRPGGGYSSWISLPRYFAPGELYRRALQHGFAFTPGEAYQIDDERHEFLRLCFGNQRVQAIRAGVMLLSQLIKEQIATGSPSSNWIPIV